MSHLIREATMQDTLALSTLMSELTASEVTVSDMENRLQFVASSPFDTLYVYEDQVIGVVGVLGFRLRENLEEVSRFGEISVIVVSESFKRRGVGARLLEFAEELADRHDCKGTWLVSGYKRTDEAHKFYIAMGFEDTGVRFVKKR